MDSLGGDREPAGFADKGLRRNTLGMFSSIAVGVASTAPAYSLAATLGFVVAVVGLRTLLLVVVAFVPIAGLTRRRCRSTSSCSGC